MRGVIISVVLCALTGPFCQVLAGENATFVLSPVVVTSERHMEAEGRATIDREILDTHPGVQRDTNEALRTVPGVQFSDSATSSDQGGEIQPARISISGGRTYENAFRLDGMSASTLLDPDSMVKPGSISSLPGHPQMFFLSPELLDGIDVYSSNIPASIGGFTGGAVLSRTRFPDPTGWGAIKYWTTRSQWSELHSDNTDFSSSSSSTLQPNFERTNIDLMANFPVTNATAFLGAFSMRHAAIPLEIDDNPQEEKRTALNTLLKVGHVLPDGGKAFASLLYAPYTGEHYISNQRDSEIDLNMDPWQIQVGRDWKLGFGTMEAALGYQDFVYSREAQPTLRQWLNTPSKDWGGSGEKFSNEGGYGDLGMSQKTWSTSVDFRADPLELIGTTHLFESGLVWEGLTGSYERSETAYVYYSATKAKKVADPTGGYFDSVNDEQYFSKRSVYDADQVEASMNTLAVYLQDEWTVARLTLRPGVRASHDDFLDNMNVAPRFAAQYDLFADQQTFLVGGINRYYGQGLLTYKLREGRKELRRETRTIDTNGNVFPEVGETDGYWRTGDPSKSNYRFSSLDTPYADECVLGLDHKLLIEGVDLGNLSLRWINRWYEDEFAREKVIGPDGDSYYVMNNNGFSRYKGVTGAWSKNWDDHYLELNLTIQDTITSNDNYDVTLDDEALDDEVWYGGSLMDKADLPRTDYNRPWLANLIYTARLPYHFSFTNVTRARAGYTAILDADKTVTIDGAKYPVYEKVERDPVYVFDWKVTWDAPIKGANVLTVGLEVLNVFDAQIPVGDTKESFEMGRQFWAGLEYKF